MRKKKSHMDMPKRRLVAERSLNYRFAPDRNEHPLDTFMRRANISVQQLADSIQVSRTLVHRWLTGERTISNEMLVRLSQLSTQTNPLKIDKLVRWQVRSVERQRG